jgi:hypothetical protein
MKALGFRQFRTRFHGDLVRIEITPGELPRALTMAGAKMANTRGNSLSQQAAHRWLTRPERPARTLSR